MWEDGEPTMALLATQELLACWVGMDIAGPHFTEDTPCPG